jgi:radical SAM superfamily enzyme YgiQ (UPF0313 family)
VAIAPTRVEQEARRSVRVAFVNPELVVQRDDPFTTGIVYMPISLAYAAAAARAAGFDTRVVDAFGEAPTRGWRLDRFLVLGLGPDEVVARIGDATIVVVYANAVVNHEAVVTLLRKIREARPGTSLVALENTQAVTAYALAPVAGDLYRAGATHLMTGGDERELVALIDALAAKDADAVGRIPGVLTASRAASPVSASWDLDILPYPAWDLFPLERYWGLRLAHGPQSARRYLPLQTSRGCPYPCRFCVIPGTNGQRWRGKAPMAVVDEIEHLMRRYGVTEFHIEDVDPTVSEDRFREICSEIVRRGLDIQWKIVAGTKVETIKHEETIDQMAAAGCRYISISPETGSPRLLKLMKKPFDLEHAVSLVRRMTRNGIHSQACFVLGFPGENDWDRALTRALVQRLTKEGVDEIALFIITPVPGSSIFPEFTGYSSLSELNFSPAWRADYGELVHFRVRLYAAFLFWKLRYHPRKILRQPLNFIRRRFETKMEMAPYRAAVLRLLDTKVTLSGRLFRP